MPEPDIVWIGSPNFGLPTGTRGQLEPVAIVYHIAQGTLSGIDAWFNNPNSGVSSHFAVGKLGEIHQYVGLKDASWANGAVNDPDLSIPWLRECVEEGINPNKKTITIEHEGYSGQGWPEAQYQSSLALTKWLIETHGPLDMIGHFQIDSVNKSNCPGTGWDKPRMLKDLEDEMLDENTDWETFKKMAQKFMMTRGGGHFPNILDSNEDMQALFNRNIDHPQTGGIAHDHSLSGKTGKA